MELAIDTRHAIAIHVPKTEGEYRRSPDKAIWRTTRELKMDTYNALSTSGAMYTSKMCPKAAEHGARCDGSSKGAGRRNAGASAHAGARDRAGTAGVGDHQGHRMPKPQPHEATWPPTLSVLLNAQQRCSALAISPSQLENSHSLYSPRLWMRFPVAPIPGDSHGSRQQSGMPDSVLETVSSNYSTRNRAYSTATTRHLREINQRKPNLRLNRMKTATRDHEVAPTPSTSDRERRGVGGPSVGGLW